MNKKKRMSGINIQWPISESILAGKKSVETRTYPLPQKYHDVELAIIETPGKNGNFKARIVGKIIFESSFPYKSKSAFYKDYHRHLVDEYSPWRWNSEKPKWGWIIKSVTALKSPIQFNGKKGIVFTKSCM